MFYHIKRTLWWLPDKIITKILLFYLNNIDFGQQLTALQSTAQFVTDHMSGVASFDCVLAIRDYAFRHAKQKGLYLEFGVWKGSGVNFFAERTDEVIHGFDSFKGLPQVFSREYPIGRFDMKGALPSVRKNVELHVGYFDETLPLFIRKFSGPVSFLHIDCDLYESTQTIFRYLGDRIGSGTVILFDDFFNYSTWLLHEYKAFQEFIAGRNLKYEYIAYNRMGTQAAVRIK